MDLVKRTYLHKLYQSFALDLAFQLEAMEKDNAHTLQDSIQKKLHFMWDTEGYWMYQKNQCLLVMFWNYYKLKEPYTTATCADNVKDNKWIVKQQFVFKLMTGNSQNKIYIQYPE